ncbi:MAG TPA: lysylphosphatidylglycerol synthase transmembrane domain-containing protein [Blastocatellia bacterium]|nr:lysylphosphatidylglycerol synthase transmembrane domain-containing protein [Blastocatellia bacterium]
MTSLGTAERRPLVKRFKPALGYLLAVAGLIWVLHDVHPAKLLEGLTGIDWRLIAPALACDVLSYICQGWRWRLLLRPVGEISTLRTTQAIYAGLFTNEILPMRIGELARAWLVSRWASAKFLAIIPSIVVERLFDGIWVAIGVGLTASFAPLPKSLLAAGETFGAIIILAVSLCAFLAFRKRESGAERARLHFPNWKPLRGIASLLERFGDGLRETGRTRAFYLAFALSPVFILLQMLAYWLIMLGYGIRLSFWIGMAVFLIVHLGTAIPNAPANVGSYQFFTVLGLTLFGADKTRATGFSLVVFALLTLPLFVIGFIALSRSGTTLMEIRREFKNESGQWTVGSGRS